jgi:hypothetical protein
LICLESSGFAWNRFQLTNTGIMMDFTNIAKTVSANQYEEVWLVLQFYRDQKHLEDAMVKMEHDEFGPQLFRDFMGLVNQDPASLGGFQQSQALDN